MPSTCMLPIISCYFSVVKIEIIPHIASVKQRPQRVVPDISQLGTWVMPTLDYRLNSLAPWPGKL